MRSVVKYNTMFAHGYRVLSLGSNLEKTMQEAVSARWSWETIKRKIKGVDLALYSDGSITASNSKGEIMVSPC